MGTAKDYGQIGVGFFQVASDSYSSIYSGGHRGKSDDISINHLRDYILRLEFYGVGIHYGYIVAAPFKDSGYHSQSHRGLRIFTGLWGIY